MCQCGEGCEKYSCFVGADCECCKEAFGDSKCDCHECRIARWDSEKALEAER